MWENVEQAFKDLDDNSYSFFSKGLAAFRRSLMSQGFTRREAQQLVMDYARFIYDSALEEMRDEREEEELDINDLDLDDVDEEEDDDLR